LKPAPFAAAKGAGFNFQESPLLLTPQDKLVNIVKQSQDKALAGEGGEDEDAQG
jgi:CRISPR-associated protein Csb1